MTGPSNAKISALLRLVGYRPRHSPSGAPIEALREEMLAAAQAYLDELAARPAATPSADPAAAMKLAVAMACCSDATIRAIAAGQFPQNGPAGSSLTPPVTAAVDFVA